MRECKNEKFVQNMLSHSKSVKDAFFDLPLKLLFQPSKLKIS
jgi:hypothetical protein